MIPVKSSNVESMGYDISTFILRIKFLSGRLYEYSNVPLAVFHGLQAAESKGKYVNQNIVKKYAYKKISEETK
jgi:hypothetical protein